jgi:hypothetical protein
VEALTEALLEVWTAIDLPLTHGGEHLAQAAE